VRQRQEDADDDKNEAEEVADHFRRELERRGHDPNSQCIFIPSQIAAWWLGAATNMRWATNKASAHLKTLGIRELSKTKSSGRLGWRWAGTAVPRTGEQITSMMPLRDLPEEDRSSQGTAERH
jgi:hypothetical protein